MAQIGNLVVQLEANIASFNANMAQAGKRTEQAMERIRGASDTARSALEAIGVGVSVGAFALLVKGSIDAADNLRDMSMKTGIAVEELNGLGFAAGQAGGSLESMAAAAGKLNKSIAEAAGGNKETSAAFSALGISVTDANGNLKKADVVMAEVADKFVQFQDGPEKSALAMALFGKAGADMIPLLNDGGEAMRENIEYAKQYSGATTELSNMSDNFNDTMGKLTVQQTSFGNAMATALLPILQSVADEMLGASEQSDKFALATNVVRTVLETFVVVGSEVAYTFKAVGTEIGGIAAQLAALAQGDFKGFSAISDMMRADAEKARKEHDAFIAGILDRTPKPATLADPTAPAAKPNAPRLPSTVKPKKTDAEKALEEGTKLVANLRDEAASYGLTGAALLSYKLTQSKMPQAYKDQALALQTTVDALKAETEAEKKRADEQKKFQEEAKRAEAQNASNVEQMRRDLLDDVEHEKDTHQLRIEELQKFHDARVENEAQANALIEAEKARHERAKADMQAQYDIQSIGMAGNAADQLYGLMVKAGKDQTALGKAVFLASKAIAVAEIILNTEVAAAKAGAQLGIFGLPLATMIRVTGYASAGMVAGMAIAEASAEGGYDIPAGTNPVTQLHEREMVLPKAQADVIRGLATRGAGSDGGAMKLTIVNNTRSPIGSVTEQRISASERALIIEEAVSATASTFADPNSKTSRAMNRNFNLSRSR